MDPGDEVKLAARVKKAALFAQRGFFAFGPTNDDSRSFGRGVVNARKAA
jgi:hypothetical protein